MHDKHGLDTSVIIDMSVRINSLRDRVSLLAGNIPSDYDGPAHDLLMSLEHDIENTQRSMAEIYSFLEL